MILNLQKQINALQNNATQINSKQNTVQGHHRRFNTSKYCWTHGACVHRSNICKNKKDGHKDTATFVNKMGESLDFCHKG